MGITDRDYMRREAPSAASRNEPRPGFWARLRFALWLLWRGLWQRRK